MSSYTIKYLCFYLMVALDAAIKYNFPHGGWIQKGRKTQSGTLPDKYHLKEMSVEPFTC